jgi:hypothetical protein
MQADPKILIFLDIDGVMNTTTSCIQHRSGERFPLGTILSLNWLMNRHPLAHVVITSTRRHAGMEAMRQLFMRNSLSMVAGRIIGLTPRIVEQDIDDYREDEIERWLDSHGPVSRMVIIDDKPITGPLARHWVGTDSDTGLTKALAKQAARHIKP